MKNSRIRNAFIAFILTFSISFVALAEDLDDFDPGSVKDPIEGFNRAVYGFNNRLDKVLLKPVAKSYRFIVPEIARKGVRNVLNNLSEPVTFVNSAFQGDVEQGFNSFWRFTLNSTFGIAGIFDVAKETGLEEHKRDFGQTQGVYGVGQGAYLMLPIFGPSNVRDAFGRGVDSFIDPFDYIFTTDALIARDVVNGIDSREANLNLIDNINKTSLDPYATIRSLYTQKRWDDINTARKKLAK
jgi:phospholipid-binding lipoprotein MlaA